MDIEIILRRVDADLQTAEAELRAATGRVDELRATQTGLRLAMERYGSSPDHDIAPVSIAVLGARSESRSETPLLTEIQPRVDNAVTRATAMQAVELVLREFGRPATSNEVHDRVRALGRTETYDQVRSALAYAARRGNLARVGRGLWEVPLERPSAPENSEGPAAVTAGPSADISHPEGGENAPDHDRRPDPRGWNDDDHRDDRTVVVPD